MVTRLDTAAGNGFKVIGNGRSNSARVGYRRITAGAVGARREHDTQKRGQRLCPKNMYITASEPLLHLLNPYRMFVSRHQLDTMIDMLNERELSEHAGFSRHRTALGGVGDGRSMTCRDR